MSRRWQLDQSGLQHIGGMGLDRVVAEQYFIEAERDVYEGERRIQRQRELLAQLEREGRRTNHARVMLHEFEQLQAANVADRNRWRHELASLSKTGASAS